MGVWKKVLGVGLAAAGVMTANPMLVGAGASIVAGDIAADGQKKAAEQQDAAAQKALAVQQQAAKEAAASFSPYQSLGQGAAGTLGTMLGLQPASTGPASPSTLTGTMPTGESATPRAGMAVPREDSPQARATAQTQSGYSPQPTLGSMAKVARMRAPNGDMAVVPADDVPHYQGLGAEIIGFNGQPVGGAL